MPRLTFPEAFLFLTRQDSRVLFLIPWYGKTLLGTTDTDYNHDPDEVTVSTRGTSTTSSTELENVLRPDLWSRSDVSGATASLRALRDEPGVSPGSADERVVPLLLPSRHAFLPGGKVHHRPGRRRRDRRRSPPPPGRQEVGRGSNGKALPSLLPRG